MSVSLGLEGAVPSVLVLVASAPAALSVIAVRALVTMNYARVTKSSYTYQVLMTKS